MKINKQKALELLLSELYFREFEVIDGLNQHPKGINFYEWMYQKGLISENDLYKELQSIKDQYEED